MDVISIFETLASNGIPPREGVSLYGLVHEEAFARLERTYLDRGFRRGASAEKFVVGPYGSGKTHFLRHFLEVARGKGCATAEVALNKDLDFTNKLLVYREVSRELRVPDGSARGLSFAFSECLRLVRSRFSDPSSADSGVQAWVDALTEGPYAHPPYTRILRAHFRALLDGDEDLAEKSLRWLEGEVMDAALCKELQVARLTKPEQNIHGQRSLFTLFQVLRQAGYTGTVVAFDEAEQGFEVSAKQRDRILSMLRSELDAVAGVQEASCLILYAIVQDIIDEMARYPALSARVADPSPELTFAKGNARAPKIDLTERGDISGELRAIAARLAELFLREVGDELEAEPQDVIAECRSIADSVFEEDLTASNRRRLVKSVAAHLLSLYDGATLVREDDEPEV